MARMRSKVRREKRAREGRKGRERAHIPKTDVLHLTVATLVAVPVILERPVKRLAGTEFAEVVGVGCEEEVECQRRDRKRREDDATHDPLR